MDICSLNIFPESIKAERLTYRMNPSTQSEIPGRFLRRMKEMGNERDGKKKHRTIKLIGLADFAWYNRMHVLRPEVQL